MSGSGTGTYTATPSGTGSYATASGYSVGQGPFSFSQLLNMVYTETNRPDLVAETTQAVFEATLSAHASDYWYLDVKQAQCTFENSDYIQYIDTTTIPNFRAPAFFRKAVPGPSLFQPMSGSINDPPVAGVDPLTGEPVSSNFWFPQNTYRYLDEIDADNLIDDFGYQKQDVWYQVGTMIYFASSSSMNSGQFGWYAFPKLDIANNGAAYSSWIANLLPYLIVYKAAGTVMQKIGQDSAINAYMAQPSGNNPQGGLYWQQLKLLQTLGVKAGGK